MNNGKIRCGIYCRVSTDDYGILMYAISNYDEGGTYRILDDIYESYDIGIIKD